ncbi:Conserved_hypothetical protein [Hexamita inflata]|uniref:Uncharacterized protein n=1 Tax=Hexamita inflata TaxID=28002 RepID=A0AA86Q375_9EUKA|nr:Conserved hypothetical protein [Hexamita inflata]
MILLQIQVLNELIRSQKKEVFNCYDNKADINIFEDSKNIVLTLNSMHEPQCLFPHGVQVSIHLDSLITYEPSIYLYAYDYNSTQQISMVCNDLQCSNLRNTKTGMIIIESKTRITYLKVGSVRISRGKSSNCFHDNESYVEILDGAVVAILYPTYACLESIVMPDTVTMKIPNYAQVYLVYNDNTVSVHDPMTIDPISLVFDPQYEHESNQAAIRIKLSRPAISDGFIPSSSGIARSVKKVFIKLYFSTDESETTPLIKISQTTMNFYKFVGIANAYDSLSIQLTNDGFITRKTKGALMDQSNIFLNSLGVTSYVAEYVFTLYDVKNTDKFWFRLISPKTFNYLFSENHVQSSCSVRFPGQKCNELTKLLSQFDVSELQISINFYFYANEQMVTNYSVVVTQITDSCFAESVLHYKQMEQIANIVISANEKNKYCRIEENDALTIQISLENGTVIKTFELDYVSGQQNYQITNIDLGLKPAIQVAFNVENMLIDAITITQYELQYTSNTKYQSILTLVYVLVTNLAFTIIYVSLKFLIMPQCSNLHKIVVKTQVQWWALEMLF